MFRAVIAGLATKQIEWIR